MKKLTLCIIIILTLAACSAGGDMDHAADFSPAPQALTEYSLLRTSAATDSAAMYFVAGTMAPLESEAPAPPTTADTPRMLIRTAGVGINTKDFGHTTTEVEALTARYGGFVEASRQWIANETWRGEYTLRVPVATFDTVNTQLNALAQVRYFNTQSQDVTLEFFDTESRLRIREEELRRTEAMLEAATNLTDIINLESQITTLQLLLTAYQRRLTEIDNLASFSTIIVTVYEVAEYVPLYVPGNDSFGNRIASAFSSSLGFVVTFLSYLAMVLVFVAPPALVLFVVIYPVYRVLKKRVAAPPGR